MVPVQTRPGRAGSRRVLRAGAEWPAPGGGWGCRWGSPHLCCYRVSGGRESTGLPRHPCPLREVPLDSGGISSCSTSEAASGWTSTNIKRHLFLGCAELRSHSHVRITSSAPRGRGVQDQTVARGQVGGVSTQGAGPDAGPVEVPAPLIYCLCHLASLSLNFLISKMGIITAPTSQGMCLACDDNREHNQLATAFVALMESSGLFAIFQGSLHVGGHLLAASPPAAIPPGEAPSTEGHTC